MRQLLLGCSLVVASLTASATDLVVTDTLIGRFYAQGAADSTAHLIEPSKPVDSGCSGNRLYIDFPDKELFATALAKHLAGVPVTIVYRPGGGDRTAAPHGYFHCRVISIY